MLKIGPHTLPSQVLLAPMAGISDAPFRRICQSMGAGLTTSEMLTAKTELWHTRKSTLRIQDVDLLEVDLLGVNSSGVNKSSTLPRSMQIAGSEPLLMANAAKQCVDQGAEIVDINMGCPAKKVCNKAAGSALLRDENLVADILSAVVKAVAVPVTLKIRTGWCKASRNGTRIAHIAEQSGIQALTVHGRTRACRFTGEAEYETIAAIVDTVGLPVIANGDIDSPHKAQRVMQSTGASAVMIGRAAQGQPWLIREIDHYLRKQTPGHKPTLGEIQKIVTEHLYALYNFYGEFSGVRIARKHLKWYSQRLVEHCSNEASSLDRQSELSSNGSRIVSHNCQDQRSNCSDSGNAGSLQQNVQRFISAVNTTESPDKQQASVQQLFERLITKEDIAA